ncbi:hypothetical protein PLCT1_00292 [Planctomycetaceae bacterium]|nr:hypothetical protein PLCT1_00292 [Planctomycetaceae bacterium]
MEASSFLRPAAIHLLAAGPLLGDAGAVRVEGTHALAGARAGETVAVPAGTATGLASADVAKAAVVDAETGKVLLAQAVDTDGDGAHDLLVFQADFAPRQRRAFLVKPGERPRYRKEDFRVYGRFARERYDDFLWENDRVAHRMYGPALETWQAEPLTSSTVDVWCKRTSRLVVNDWLLVDDYHRDTGEGADFYSAGRSRGAGGSGVWKDGRLHCARNFRLSRVLAAGPIRLVFELTYEAWDAGGTRVSEVKRVTLDAGSRFNRFESFYTAGSPVAHAAGLKKAADAALRVEKAAGTIRSWEPVKGGNGNLGLALVVDPSSLADVVEADGNDLAIGRPTAVKPAVHWAGSAWDRAGEVRSVEDWDRVVAEFVERLRSPLKVEIVTP